MTEGIRRGADSDRSILLIDSHRDTAQEIARQLACFGYSVTVCATIHDLERMIATIRPIALVIDIQSAHMLQSARAPLRSSSTMPPIIVIAAQSDISVRLAALRFGSNAFLPKPIHMATLVDTLDRLTGWRMVLPYRVLIVEDTPMVATYTATILKRASMEVAIVHTPLDTLVAIEAFAPDLVLIDLYMPACTGRELAAVIRQQPIYISLPIVFLSAESDRAAQLAAIREGGDDFLTKSIQPQHLIASLRSRIERARSVRTHLVHDGLTGLLNHAAIMAQLDLVFARAQREQGACAVGLVDLDYFKRVNDTYGHVIGDRVLRSFARLLKQTLRQSDGIGRFGGEEFVIVFPATTSSGAATALEKLRERWSHVQHQAAETTFTVTMSAGIAQYTQEESAPTLLGMADQALYAAKQAGRNRVVLASDRNQ